MLHGANTQSVHVHKLSLSARNGNCKWSSNNSFESDSPFEHFVSTTFFVFVFSFLTHRLDKCIENHAYAMY